MAQKKRKLVKQLEPKQESQLEAIITPLTEPKTFQKSDFNPVNDVIFERSCPYPECDGKDTDIRGINRLDEKLTLVKCHKCNRRFYMDTKSYFKVVRW